MKPDSYFIAFASAAIERAPGIIRGVSVITEGEAKGHGCYIDATTISQVKKCCDAFGTAGVRVKVNHYSGVDAIVGILRSFRIDGTQLRADLHLLKAHEIFDRLLEMASTIPESFGLSISFSGRPEKINRVEYARCEEIYSVDIVDRPAANPSGLFSVDSKTNDTDMKPEEISLAAEQGATKANQSLLTSIREFVNGDAALRASVTELTGKLTAAETNLTATNGKVTQLTTDLATANTNLTAITAERDALKVKVEKVTADVKKLGAQEAALINASLGIPPVEVKGGDGKDKLDARAEAKKNLKGLALVIALEKIETAERAALAGK